MTFSVYIDTQTTKHFYYFKEENNVPSYQMSHSVGSSCIILRN